MSASRITPVLIADDHPIFRRGLAALIGSDPSFTVTAETGDGLEALELLRRLGAGIAVLDLSMPRLDGLDVLAQSRTWPSPPPIVLLTVHDGYVARALELGAAAYLLKEHAEDQVLRCLRAVCDGNRYVGEGMGWRVGPRGEIARSSALDVLSPSERRVLKLHIELHTAAEIARILGVSPRTVQNHCAHMCEKLGLRGPRALLRFGLDHAGEL